MVSCVSVTIILKYVGTENIDYQWTNLVFQRDEEMRNLKVLKRESLLGCGICFKKERKELEQRVGLINC